MKVLILDDHALIRDALGRVLTDLVPDAKVIEVCEPQGALAMIESDSGFDLVLLDLALPVMNGMQVLRTLRERHPSVAVVVISASVDRDSVRQAIDHGALGFIPKSSSNEVLKNALRLVLGGGLYVPPEVLGRGAAPVVNPPSGRTTPAEIGLTQRQAEILALMMKGESNKVICRRLDLAESTVKNQITTILKALNVSSRTQAVLAVNSLGLMLPELHR
jgi:DNA-binding NarL/FixJ family response regulator